MFVKAVSANRYLLKIYRAIYLKNLSFSTDKFFSNRCYQLQSHYCDMQCVFVPIQKMQLLQRIWLIELPFVSNPLSGELE